MSEEPFSSTENLPEISVIIVSWNASGYLEKCLESLSSGVARTYEVIVVDNNSSDGSATMVMNKFPWVKLIQTGANLGFAKGNNIGIKNSRGEYLALINSDALALPGCLDALSRFLDDHPDVGMVGPRVMYGDRRLQSSCRRFPTLWNNACEVLLLNRLFPRIEFLAGEHMFYFSYDRTREVEVLVGCFILARRNAINQFGLFDEAFFFYGEDIDWSRRCWQSGWRVMFYPGAEAIHFCGGSSTNSRVRFSVAQQTARLQLWAKYRSRFAVAGLMALLAWQCSARLIVAGLIFMFRLHRWKDPAVLSSIQLACLRDLWVKRRSFFNGAVDSMPFKSRQP
jgi:GT2 family glycosyltransferase